MDFSSIAIPAPTLDHEQAGQQAAQGQQDITGEAVEPVVQAVHSDLTDVRPGQLKVGHRTEAQGAEDITNEDQQTDNDDSLLTAHAHLDFSGLDVDLKEGEQGGNDSEGNADEEQRTDDTAAGQVAVDLGHNFEQQSGALGQLDASTVSGGDDNEASQDSSEGVHDGDHQSIALQVVGVGQRCTQGGEDTPADTDGEQNLSCSVCEDLEAEVLGSGQQVVLQTLCSAGSDGASVDGAAQQDDEQSRHDNLGDLLNDLGDTEQQHEHDAEQQDECPDDGLNRSRDNLVEESSGVAELAADDEVDSILQNPAADDNIVHVDHQSTQVCNPANKCPLGVDLLENGDGVALAETADSGFHFDHGVSHQSNDDDVGQQENAAASTVCQVGELPDVAQADSGAGSNHDVAEAGAKLALLLSIVAHILSPFKILLGGYMITAIHGQGKDTQISIILLKSL